MRFLVRPPKLIRAFYKGSVWRMTKSEPVIYLTFDDGPIPILTPWVLDVLKEYGVKATFFCVGENIQKNPELFERLKNEGHQIGNHTYNHLKGWQVSKEAYFENIQKCQQLTQTNLFRPPYGRVTKKQYKVLRETYKVIFWDVLTHDYSKSMNSEVCLRKSIKYTRPGSVIVFHDNVKAEKNLKYVLPLYISHFLKLNYRFEIL